MISIIGRDKEINLINTLMQQRKNIIVFGEEGVGKSTIIQRILSDKNENILHVQKNGTLRETLIGIAMAGLQHSSAIENLNILALKKKCYAIIDKAPIYIVLDHMGRVEPKHYTFLIYLLEKNIHLLVISRGLDKKCIGHLRMALYGFEKVEIKNLDRAASNNLTDYFMKEFGIKVTKEAEFKQAIFDYSGGNPKIIKGLCFLARDVKYQKNEAIDVKLMDLDRRISEAVH
ncbi:MAG: hypothetical protein NC923_02315 [Candidatus Omnitrophica bacterium]|nr:hypothetical protein [Candidatus Omnitrophota bacterium]